MIDICLGMGRDKLSSVVLNNLRATDLKTTIAYVVVRVGQISRAFRHLGVIKDKMAE